MPDVLGTRDNDGSNDTQGAHPGAAAEYATHARAHQSEIPTTPKAAREYWAAYEQEHPEYIVTARTNFAQQLAERVEAQAQVTSKREFCCKILVFRAPST